MQNNDEGIRKEPDTAWQTRLAAQAPRQDVRRMRDSRPDLEKALPKILAGMKPEAIAFKLSLLPEGVRLSLAELSSLLLMPLRITQEQCQSSNVQSFGLDQTSGVISVIFKNGGEYRYLALSEGMMIALQRSGSKGVAVASIKSSGAVFIKMPSLVSTVGGHLAERQK